jgi:D-alanine transaminase
MSAVFLNDRFVDGSEANVSVFDTGFYYGDGIYEVVLLYDGKVIDIDSHFKRLEFMIKEGKFSGTPSLDEFRKIVNELVKRNPETKTGMIYIQVTRGISENRYIKLNDLKKPTVVAYITKIDVNLEEIKKVKAALVVDPRRYRRDIKMISLMPANLAKMEAYEKGYDYVLFFDRQTKAITEGVSSNIFMVTKENVVFTHPISKKILSGCTRKKAIEFLREEGFEVKEEEFFEEELLETKEIFVTGAIKLFVSVESVNGIEIEGGSNEVATLLMNKYKKFIDTHKAQNE